MTLGDVLTDALGDRFDVELLAGFLGILGAAIAADPERARVCDTDEPSAIILEFDDREPIVVPLVPSVVKTRLNADVEAALADLRRTRSGGGWSLDELLQGVADAAQGRVTDVDEGRPLALRCIRARGEARPDESAGAAAGGAAAAAAVGWTAMRALLADGSPPLAGAEVLVAQALIADDWRARMAAVLVVGRFRMRELSGRLGTVRVPDAGRGLTDQDRRILLALRDVARARAAGRALDLPVHPDPEVAATRAGVLAAVEAAVAGTRMPRPGEPAAILSRIAS